MTIKMGRRKDGSDDPIAKRVQITLSEFDLARIDELIAAGYADNRSAVIRRSVEETHKWELANKK